MDTRSSEQRQVRLPCVCHRASALPWAVAALFLTLALGACGGGATPPGGPPPGAQFSLDPQFGVANVLDPQRTQYGASYAEWSSRWWEWALELPRTGHPLFDATGAMAAQGQVNPVWFLGGNLGSLIDPGQGVIERRVTVPNGVALFFPVTNEEKDNKACAAPGGDFLSFTALRGLASASIRTVTNVRCDVDGVRVIDAMDLAGAARFRAQAPEFFAYIPDDNVLVDICEQAPGSDVIGPIASDGIWMMLGPMEPGEHTIHFEGELPLSGISVNMTYVITVEP